MASASGLAFPAAEFGRACCRVSGSALHRAARQAGRPGLPHRPAGPVHDQLRSAVARRPPGRGGAGLGPTCRNPFRSIVVRAVETVYAADEALRIIDELRAARAVVCRGAAGRRRRSRRQRGPARPALPPLPARRVTAASSRPPSFPRPRRTRPRSRPTCVASSSASLHLDDAALTSLCERTIRNYDPCISCSAHFLDLRVERR